MYEYNNDIMKKTIFNFLTLKYFLLLLATIRDFKYKVTVLSRLKKKFWLVVFEQYF